MHDRHSTPEELGRYHDGLLSPEEARSVEMHVGRCGSCSDALGVIRAFDDALASEEVWHFAEELETREAQGRLADLAEQISREDEEAERMLRPHLVTPFRFVWSKLAGKKRFRTGGTVRVLARASTAAREEHPLHALNLADEAIAIAESLPSDAYPARGVYHLHGLAWKERANACRYLNRYAEALDALDHAARAYRRLLQNDLELTIVEYIRGTVLWKQQRLDEALPLARRVAERFASLGEHERWVHAKMLEGSILGDLGAPELARDLFTTLAEHVEVRVDAVTCARIESSLANTFLALGDLGSASKHYLVALQLFESLGVATEAARVRWSIGTVALVSGNHVEAARRLAAAMEECEVLGMPGDAALVGLDLLEALVLLGRHDQVRSLATAVLERAKEAGMVPAALTAMAFLREAAESGRLTSSGIGYVKRFLRQLEAEPALQFVRPPEPRRS
jgi:tetratricopeptide (TPR) repeat protein